MLRYSLILILIFSMSNIYTQPYTSYFTGNTDDLVISPLGGTCMMGGATENDEAMKWFLQRANGGDILVLRASGSDGYNNYLYSQLGVSVNSVETIVFNNATASNESYVQQRISQAEAIWFAGGDQWNYVSFWRNTAIDSLINDGIQNRNMVIGGTSAGMAILGSLYYSAEFGSATSSVALSNPYANSVHIDSTHFLQVPFLQQVITDTHYDNPDRKGRHITFLARVLTDWGVSAKGIACDEFTAVCIDETGLARTYGEYPGYDDNVYFLQVNCENDTLQPENCTNGQPLNWNLGGDAVKVYAVKGTLNGSNTFDLNTWESGTGGNWENWYVDNGTLVEQADSAINCIPVSTNSIILSTELTITPTLVNNNHITLQASHLSNHPITIYNSNGQLIQTFNHTAYTQQIDVIDLNSGVYFLKFKAPNETIIRRFVKL